MKEDMSLTEAEKMAYDWLKQKYPDKEICRDKTPDFRVGNEGFEVKKLIGKNILHFNKGQQEKCVNQNILIVDTRKNVIVCVPFEELANKGFRATVANLSKAHIHLFVEQDEWLEFRKNCIERDLVPSREIQRWMKTECERWEK